MAKKATPKKPMKASSKPPKSEAKPLGTPAAPKKHERTAKPSEADKLVRGRMLALTYLVQRDGLPEDVAAMVVNSMDADAVNELIAEANTAVMDRPKSAAAEAMPKESEPEEFVPDFVTVEKLVTSEEFATYAQNMIDAAKIKNQAEAEYKRLKNRVIGILDDAATPKVMFLGYRLSRYEGNNKTLNAQMLIEKGVDPAIITQCYKDSKYQDVRITPPSQPKGE